MSEVLRGRSIAEACKLSRETVRRKVVKLAERGYIYRSDEGLLYLTTHVGDDFADMTADIVEHLLNTARRLESLLASRPTRLAPLRLDLPAAAGGRTTLAPRPRRAVRARRNASRRSKGRAQ